MRILGVGNATMDYIQRVSGYPTEDAEVRALSRHRALGGNTANTLVSLSRLGHRCSWAGTLSDEQESRWLLQRFADYAIDTSHAVQVGGAALPLSTVLVNIDNGSRTIVHYRDLPELAADDFKKIDLTAYDWIHFEGRNVEALEQMFCWLKQQGFTSFSLEIEKAREDIDRLFVYPAVLMFSRHYVRENHEGSIRDFFRRIRENAVTCPVYCGWGSAGGWAMDSQAGLYQQPAWKPEKVIDTLGAGDAFNSAIIDATLCRLSVESVLAWACKVAGYKCGIQGFDAISSLQDERF